MPQTDPVSPGHKLRIAILDAVRRGLLPLVLLVVPRHAALELFQVNVLAVHYDYAEDACGCPTLILNLSLY